MPETDNLTIRRILKVNHAGEFGAIRIYRAQLWISRRWYPDLVPFLEDTLEHEIQHCEAFLTAMPSRKARPCRAMSLWSTGGLALGILTALLGRQGIWICTEAVEETVHKHLDDQLLFLRERDSDLHTIIAGIQSEELQHLKHATERISTRSVWKRCLSSVVANSTEAVIWLSTWGDSRRMTKALLAANRSER